MFLDRASAGGIGCLEDRLVAFAKDTTGLGTCLATEIKMKMYIGYHGNVRVYR